jgi:predicted GNAT family acetyltransferase
MGARATGNSTGMAEVIDNRALHRFELSQGGHVAELVYERDDGRLVLVHTGVPDELSGQGIGGQLVQGAVDEAARNNLTLVAKCPNARSWLEKHRSELGSVIVEDVA